MALAVGPRNQSFNQFGSPVGYTSPHYQTSFFTEQEGPTFGSQPRVPGGDRHASHIFGNYDPHYYQPLEREPYPGYLPVGHDGGYSPSSYSTVGSPITNTDSRHSSPQQKKYSRSDSSNWSYAPSSRTSNNLPPSEPAALHQKPHCAHPDCLDGGRPVKFFSRKADVGRHYRSQHERVYMDCPRHRCARKGENGFTRSDHLKEHLRQYHQMELPKRSEARARGGAR